MHIYIFLFALKFKYVNFLGNADEGEEKITSKSGKLILLFVRKSGENRLNDEHQTTTDATAFNQKSDTQANYN